MNYIVIGEASTAQGRIRMYVQLQASGLLFAAKRQVENEEARSIKTGVFNDLLCWIGFDDLAMALYQSPKMQAKYKFQNTQILPNLIVNQTKGESFFFVKSQEEWIWTTDTEDLYPVFGEHIGQQIDRIMGQHFIREHERQWAEIRKAEPLYSKSISSIKQDLMAEISAEQTETA